MGRINVTYTIFEALRCQQQCKALQAIVSRLLDLHFKAALDVLHGPASTLLAQDHCFSDSTRAHAKVRAPELP
jgi:ribosomal protein RSM22 (predicted rRNA methylase)